MRLPQGVFSPYTTINTNLLFFTKGTPTKDIWFYEHPYPKGVKSYNKTKPMKLEEFDAEKQWWGNEEDAFDKRKESNYSWKASLGEIKARNYNLDFKNPHVADRETLDPEKLLGEYLILDADINNIRDRLKLIISKALESGRS